MANFVGNGVAQLAGSIKKVSNYTPPPGFNFFPNGTIEVAYAAGQATTEATALSHSLGGTPVFAILSALGKGGPGNYTYRFGKYEDAPYHHRQSKGGKGKNKKSPCPKDGQMALDNSVQVLSETGASTTRVAINNGEFVVLMESAISTSSNPVFHGHIREWSKLTDYMKQALVKADLVKPQASWTKCKILKEILN